MRCPRTVLLAPVVLLLAASRALAGETETRPTPSPAPQAAAAAPPLSELRILEVREGAAVVVTASGSMRVVRAGDRIGEHGDTVVAVEADRMILQGLWIEDGKKGKSYVTVTWDAEGRMRERRGETLRGALPSKGEPDATKVVLAPREEKK